LELPLGLLRNVHHSSVWDNLRALLGRIFESSVPRNLIAYSRPTLRN